MTDRTIQVNVGVSTPKNISVSSAQVSNDITASADTSKFWAQTAKNWAVSTNIVDNEDYSSKYYANKANNSALTAKDFAQAAQESYNQFNNSVNDVLSDINERFEEGVGEGLNQITILVDNSIAEYTEISNQIKQDNSEASKLAQEWATSEVIVDNIDYSAKYYAKKAKDNSGIFYDEVTDEDIDVEIISGGYVTKADLELGLDTKQDKGDYALKEEIPSLDGYVKDTDYATRTTGGVVKINETFGLYIDPTSGTVTGVILALNTYDSTNKYVVISKGTLENIKDDYIKRGVTENTIELTDDEKANAKQWLGYATPTDIMQAIASIPQFKLSIINELPLAGEKMTLYLVPKEGTNNDVYDEYIWIEQTASFEHLGTTAVDLTDYVKKTDYAGDQAGVIKVSSIYGVRVSPYNNGYISGFTMPLEQLTNNQIIISKGSLDNVLTQYSKTVSITQADYDSLETKDSNTLYLIEE